MKRIIVSTFILIVIYLLVTNSNIYRRMFEEVSSKISDYYRTLVKGGNNV